MPADPANARAIYKIVAETAWREARAKGVFDGAAIDLSDGFIHFSGAGQVERTAQLHFAGQAGLLLVAVDPSRLGPSLKWESSRGGEDFPHLYGTLPFDAVLSECALPLRADGSHDFTGLLP